MIVDAVLRELASGSGKAALVTLASASGSTPREAGSRMLLRPDGSRLGTVGGGQGEARAIEEAASCLASGKNARVRFEMLGAEAKGVDVICGGVAEFWIEVVESRELYVQAIAEIDRGSSCVLVSSAEKGGIGLLSREDGSLERGEGPAYLDESGSILYSPLEPPERLLILGGGHVGLALAKAGQGLSFAVTLADPRSEYSDPGRFPQGIECLTAAYDDIIASFPSGSKTYVVVVSPGHLGDLDCARSLLRGDYRYVGIIGSRRKTRMLIEALVAEGFPREKVEALRMPIGLDIGALTPEEIAIAILAEIIAVRHDSPFMAWADKERRARRLSS
jgi:xanthine dehydrogenase accessory factor